MGQTGDWFYRIYHKSVFMAVLVDDEVTLSVPAKRRVCLLKTNQFMQVLPDPLTNRFCPILILNTTEKYVNLPYFVISFFVVSLYLI